MQVLETENTATSARLATEFSSYIALNLNEATHVLANLDSLTVVDPKRPLSPEKRAQIQAEVITHPIFRQALPLLKVWEENAEHFTHDSRLLYIQVWYLLRDEIRKYSDQLVPSEWAEAVAQSSISAEA